MGTGDCYMFEKEDTTYIDIKKKSVDEWLIQMSEHEDLSVRGGVKATSEYIESLKKRVDDLNEKVDLYGKYLQKLKDEKKRYPVIEFDSEEVSLINPDSMLSDFDSCSDKLIITFFSEVMETLKKENAIELYYTIGGENPVEIYKFISSNVLITLGYVGCPACAGNLECFIAMGVNKVMFCGGGGVLDENIDVGTLLVVEGAIRDEGLSYQYVPADRIIYTDQDLTQRISCYLSRENIPHIKGLTWTTDAVFRENKKRISRRKKEGALIVEMEQSGCIAVSQYKGIEYGAIIYGGDDVSGDKWDDRSWSSRYGIRYDLVLICRDILMDNEVFA